MTTPYVVEVFVGESIFLFLLWERPPHTSFFSNTFLPDSNTFYTEVQLSTKSDVFYRPVFLLCLIICFQLAV